MLIMMNYLIILLLTHLLLLYNCNKKIIVFEDIDCIGDIILERNNKNKKNKNIKINSNTNR